MGKLQGSPVQVLRVYMLGRFRLCLGEVDLRPERWELQKAASVFKYLVSEEGRWVSSDRLIELFWPDMDPDRARNALRTTVYRLRHWLEPGLAAYAPSAYVAASRGYYRFRVEAPHWVDFIEFLRMAQVAQRGFMEGRAEEALVWAEQALQLYTDDFLPEDRFEDWTAHWRDRLQQEYLGLVFHLAVALRETESGRRRAILHLRAALQRAPEREDLQRELIAALAAVGNVGEALRQYEALCRWLDQEYGVEPAPETADLVERIRRGERPVDPLQQPEPGRRPGPERGLSVPRGGRHGSPPGPLGRRSPGAFVVNWRTFQQVVHLERRQMRRFWMPLTVAVIGACAEKLDEGASWEEAEALIQAEIEGTAGAVEGEALREATGGSQVGGGLLAGPLGARDAQMTVTAPASMASWQAKVAAQLRQGDVVCPLGQRSLVVLLPQADAPTARHVIGRLVGTSKRAPFRLFALTPEGD